MQTSFICGSFPLRSLYAFVVGAHADLHLLYTVGMSGKCCAVQIV